MKSSSLLVAATILMIGTPCVAQSTRGKLQDLYACRAVEGTTARLACYERQSAILEDAERRSEIAVVDTRAEQQQRRAAFGAKVSDKARANAALAEIRTTLVSATPGGAGLLVFALADGARWIQVDDAPIPGRLRPGSNVVVKRTMLGGYKMTIDSRPAFKVRRL